MVIMEIALIKVENFLNQKSKKREISLRESFCVKLIKSKLKIFCVKNLREIN